LHLSFLIVILFFNGITFFNLQLTFFPTIPNSLFFKVRLIGISIFSSINRFIMPQFHFVQLNWRLNFLPFLLMIAAFHLQAQQTYYFESWTTNDGTQDPALEKVEAKISDEAGNLYIAGVTLNSYGHYDAFVTKYFDTQRIWTNTYNIDTLGDAIPGHISFDQAGNIILCGTAFNGPTKDYDLFVVKYTSSGTQSWVTTYNGPASKEDGGKFMATDTSGNIYITGASVNTGSDTDILTLSLGSNGSQKWVKHFDGNGLDDAGASIRYLAGNVHVNGPIRDTSGTWQYASIIYASSSGTLSTTNISSGTFNIDEITDFVIDEQQNVYITGYFFNLSNGLNCQTAKLSPTMQVLWSADYSASGNEQALAITLDGDNNVYITGYTAENGNDDYLIIKYSNDGNQIWKTTYNGQPNEKDWGTDLGVKGAELFVTGWSEKFGEKDFLTLKMDTSGSAPDWTARFNAVYNNDDIPTALEIDANDDIVILGQSETFTNELTYVTTKYAKEEIYRPLQSSTSTSFQYIENAGQLQDTSGNQLPEIKFYVQKGHPSIYFFDNKVSFVQSKIDTSSNDTLHRIDMKYSSETSNSQRIYTSEEAEAFHNYYLGHLDGGRERVRLLNELTQVNAFGNGINIIYNNKTDRFGFDISCAPLSNPSTIEFNFSGQDTLYLDTSGNLILETILENIVFPRPTAYQIDNDTLVSLAWQPSFTISDTTIRVTTGSYNTNNPLVFAFESSTSVTTVLNGNLEWCTFLGENQLDRANAVTSDNEGNVLYAGETRSLNFPSTSGSLIDNELAGSSDAFVTKYNSNGEALWGTYFGGSGFAANEFARDIETDGNGDVYVTGVTTSSDLEIKPFNNSSFGGVEDAWVAKFSGDGNSLLFSAYIGGNARDDGYDLAIDPTNEHLYVVGFSQSNSGFPTETKSGGYNQVSNLGDSDGFIVEFDEEYNQVWGTFFGGDEDENFSSIEI
jgi:hypothetical protein